MNSGQIDRRLLLQGTVAAGALMLSGLATPAFGLERLRPKAGRGMPTFRSPTINLYSRDLARAMAFYADLGFVETFRTPTSGPPAHVELQLDGFTLGIAAVEAAEKHGLRPNGEGRWMEIVLWTDDVDAAATALTAKGAPLLSAPHDFLEAPLRSAWIADPDGNPIQLVQERN
jgi:catechol 2,3-dioxygenase-like lactoylglutathione lyase family enzyme